MEIKLLIVISYFLCAFIIGDALFSTPDLSTDLHQNASTKIFFAYVFYFGICAYPWWKLYFSDKEYDAGKLTFSILSVVLAIIFYNPISTGRDFTIGMFVILYLISIGIIFLVTRYIK